MSRKKTKKITPRNLLIFLLAAAAAALLGAYISQYFFDLQPCQLCLWQRKPFFGIITISAIFLIIPFLKKHQHFAVKAALLLLLINAAIAFYHAGVEKKYFKGLSSCSGIMQTPHNLDELIIFLEKASIVPCNEPQFMFLEISMAGWNFIYCLIIALLLITISSFNNRSKNRK
ncbi:MAG: disulfide bond formation protein DsbB [Lentimonas sp.]|jgi:disulfide bond formation protein DsbB